MCNSVAMKVNENIVVFVVLQVDIRREVTANWSKRRNHKLGMEQKDN